MAELFDEVGKVEVTRGNLQHETKKLQEIQQSLQVRKSLMRFRRKIKIEQDSFMAY